MSISARQISKARANLILDQPFFASLLLPMPINECKEIGTFSTDGESIIYNPEWADKLTQQETTFVLAHEILHCVFDHMGRRESRTPNRWNQAADYIINDLLVSEKIGSMPQGGLLDSALVKRGNGTAEGVYKLLPESSEGNKPGKPGGSLDDIIGGKIPPPGVGGQVTGIGQIQSPDASERAQKSADIKVRVIQARNAAKMQGKLSERLDRLVSEAVKPVIDWKNELRRFLSERAKVDYSFSRPKRRFLGEDLYLPSLTGEKLGALTIAVDCSGSVSKDLLAKFSAEINAIKQDAQPSRIQVVYFHHQVICADTFEADQEVIFKKTETGGTAFSPVFEFINAQVDLPIACVFLTDLHCNDFGPAPDYPVLWAVVEDRSTGRTAPFGEILPVSEDA